MKLSKEEQKKLIQITDNVAFRYRQLVDDHQDMASYLRWVILNSLKNFKEGNLFGYIQFRLKNATIDYIRNHGAITRSGYPRIETPKTTISIDFLTQETATTINSLSVLLKRFIQTLPDKNQQEIIKRCYFDGEKINKIAAELGITAPKAWKYHANAKKLIHGLIERNKLIWQLYQ